MARRIGPNGVRIVIDPGDSSVSIARDFVGDAGRAGELVSANPQKDRSAWGDFRVLVPGERLTIPASWAQAADAKGLGVDEAAGLDDDEAGAILPSGWTSSDVQIVNWLAQQWGVSPEALLVTWYEESGLQPRIVSPLGGMAPDGQPSIEYAGLIEGITSQWSGGRRVYVIDETFHWPAGTWKTVVTQTPLATQLQAIAVIWDRIFKTYLRGETLRQFSDRMGVEPAAVIHALNFLPARVAGLKTADSPLASDPENFYTANRGLDTNNDGVITLRDFERHFQTKLAELEKSTKLGPLLAEARGDQPPQGTLAALFAPISGQWKSLTGQMPIVAVGWNEPPRGGGIGGLVAVGIVAGALWYFGRRYL